MIKEDYLSLKMPESLGTRYKNNNKHTGTIGLMGAISFNANKIITTGSGGMILTNNYI